MKTIYNILGFPSVTITKKHTSYIILRRIIMRKIQGILAGVICAAFLSVPASAKCDDHKAAAKKTSSTSASSCCATKQMSADEKAEHCATKDKAACEMKGAKAEKVSKKVKTAKTAKTEVKAVKETSSK